MSCWKAVLNRLESTYSQDHLAVLTPLSGTDQSTQLQLTVTHSGSRNHTYEIIHYDNCNRLSAIDGIPLSPFITVSWPQHDFRALSVQTRGAT